MMDAIEQMREVLRGMVNALIDDGFTSEQAHDIARHLVIQGARA